MTLADRKQVAEALLKIVNAEYRRAYGVRALLQRGLRSLVEQAQQMGLQPDDLFTPNGHDAFTAIARAVFAPVRPMAPRDQLNAEWRTVVQLAA